MSALYYELNEFYENAVNHETFIYRSHIKSDRYSRYFNLIFLFSFVGVASDFLLIKKANSNAFSTKPESIPLVTLTRRMPGYPDVQISLNNLSVFLLTL